MANAGFRISGFPLPDDLSTLRRRNRRQMGGGDTTGVGFDVRPNRCVLLAEPRQQQRESELIMPHTITNPAGLHNPVVLGYSHVASIPASSELVYIAGQFAVGPELKVVSSDFDEQVERSFANLGTALASVGLDFSHVIRLGTYIIDRDREKVETLVRVCQRIWGDKPPVQTLLGIAFFADPDQRFEVDAVAVRP